MPMGVHKRKIDIYTPERNLKISLALTGRKGKSPSQKTRNKISKKLKGRKKPIGFSKKISGINNYGWKGDLATYETIHDWIRRKLGKLSYCEHCKRTDKKKYEW